MLQEATRKGLFRGPEALKGHVMLVTARALPTPGLRAKERLVPQPKRLAHMKRLTPQGAVKLQGMEAATTVPVGRELGSYTLTLLSFSCISCFALAERG